MSVRIKYQAYISLYVYNDIPVDNFNLWNIFIYIVMLQISIII